MVHDLQCIQSTLFHVLCMLPRAEADLGLCHDRL